MTAVASEQSIELLNAEPSRELRSIVLQRTDELAMIPSVAVEALEIAKNPDCSISKFASVVERDIKLASDILGMANSVMYAAPKAIVSLHQAVLRIGFRQCKNLILSRSISSLMKRLSQRHQSLREELWQHSFSTALLAMNLNRSLNLGFHGEEFTAGLIHDIGRTLLVVAEPELFSQRGWYTFDEDAELLHREREAIGTDHCALGAWFVKRSNLPDALVDVIRYHHLPSQATDNQMLVAVTAAADHMANHLQRCNGSDGYAPNENDGIVQLSKLDNKRITTWFAETAHLLLEVTFKDAAEMKSILR